MASKPSSIKTKFIKKVPKRSKPEALVIKELQTDQMPRREALQAMNEIDIVG